MRLARLLGHPVALATGSSLACAALLLAAEWSVRRAHPERLRRSAARSAVVHSADYGWQLRANWTQRDGAGFTTDGARCRRQPPPAAEGAPRVLVLGDSITFGTGVADEETFAHLLGRRGLTVANFAVPGWGTDQSLLRFEREGGLFRPSVVALNVCLANDLADNMLPSYLYDPHWPKPYFTAEDGELRLHDAHVHPSAAVRAWRSLWERSHLLNLLAAPAGGPAEESDDAHWLGRRKRAVKDEESAVRLAVLQVRRLRARADGAGARFVVLLHPDRAAFEERSDLSGLLGEALRADGIETIDLAERYRQSAWVFSDLTLDGLGHLSPRGHQVVADVLAAAIQR
ncbi:MAG: GDSL-type esterase/lipase family protein [Vicinamibacteria bacterium]